MEWLARNWIWLLLAVGFVFVMRRGGMGGGHGSHRSHDGGHGADRGEDASRAESVTDPVRSEPIDPRGGARAVCRCKRRACAP